MPPRRYSRHTFTSAGMDDAGALVLSDPEPFRYRELADTRTHVVRDGETLFTLAGRYFSPMRRPAGLWWIIADFQPEPIVDPTIALAAGRMIFVPSVRAVTELVFSETRREETS